MKVRVEIVETLRKFVDVDVDAMDEQEIQVEIFTERCYGVKPCFGDTKLTYIG